jgi:hypothetical protein
MHVRKSDSSLMDKLNSSTCNLRWGTVEGTACPCQPADMQGIITRCRLAAAFQRCRAKVVQHRTPNLRYLTLLLVLIQFSLMLLIGARIRTRRYTLVCATNRRRGAPARAPPSKNTCEKRNRIRGLSTTKRLSKNIGLSYN